MHRLTEYGTDAFPAGLDCLDSSHPMELPRAAPDYLELLGPEAEVSKL